MLAGTSQSLAPAVACAAYRPRAYSLRACVTREAVMMTVAPRSSRPATMEPAMEPGAAPVTSATSPSNSGVKSPVAASAMRARTPRRVSSSVRCAHQRACPATVSPVPAKRAMVAVSSVAASAPVAMRASSSRAIAQRSSKSTARSASNTGVTSFSHWGPSSDSTASSRAPSAEPPSLSSGDGVSPSVSRMVRAVAASTPSGPVTVSA